MKTDVEFYQDAVDFWVTETKEDEEIIAYLKQKLRETAQELNEAKSRLQDSQAKLSYWQGQLEAVSKSAVYPPPQA